MLCLLHRFIIFDFMLFLAVNCEGSWSDFGDCSETCGDGLKTKTFTIEVDQVGLGDECDANHNQEMTEACNEGECGMF